MSVTHAAGLMDEIVQKLSQAQGICWVLHGGKDYAVIGDRAIRDSLWAVDELIDDARKAVDALYEEARKEVQS